MSTVRQYKSRVTRSYASLTDVGEGASRYTSGAIQTPMGYVRAYTQPQPNPYSVVQFMHEGVNYVRSVHKHFTHRGLSTFGNRLARDVVNGNFAAASLATKEAL